MNYKLSVLTDDENYKLVDLSTIFKDKKKIYDLESIDEFTMSFEDENALKKELLSSGVIKEEDLNKSLCIKYGDKNIRQTDIMYSKSKKTVFYIRDFSTSIIKYYNKNKKNQDFYRYIVEDFEVFKTIAGNRELLKKLIQFVYDAGIPKIDTSEIVVYLYSNEENDKKLFISLYDLFKRVFYKFDKNSKEYKFNYKSFRNYCLFYLDYKFSKVNNNKNDNSKDDYKTKWILSSDDDPDFPPNSFEEDGYRRYLEELEEGFAPDPDSYFAGNSLGKK